MNDTISSDSSPILRTLAMPTDTNPNGDVFGGWIMSQMDIAGGILAIDGEGKKRAIKH